VRRELVDYATDTHGASLRLACRAVGISRSSYQYQPDRGRDDEVIVALQAAVERYPAYGFSKLYKILRRQGHSWNHKRVYRVYCLLNLNKRRRGKRRLPNRNPEPLAVPSAATTHGSAGTMEVPGTFVLAMIFLVSFVLYYFVNWKYLASVWHLS